jgi:hypothetical protein
MTTTQFIILIICMAVAVGAVILTIVLSTNIISERLEGLIKLGLRKRE